MDFIKKPNEGHLGQICLCSEYKTSLVFISPLYIDFGVFRLMVLLLLKLCGKSSNNVLSICIKNMNWISVTRTWIFYTYLVKSTKCMLFWQFFLMRFGFISWMSCRFRNHIGCNVSLAKPFKVLDFVWKFGGFKADHTVNCFVFIVASSVLLRHRCQLTRQHRGELLQKQN